MRIIIEDSNGKELCSFDAFNFHMYEETIVDLNTLNNCVVLDLNKKEKKNEYTTGFRDDIRIRINSQ